MRPGTISTLFLIALLFSACNDNSTGTGDKDLPEETSMADLRLSLDPDQVVFAISRGGGMVIHAGQEFFWLLHPDFSLYVFGDGRIVRLSRPDDGKFPRVYLQGQVPEARLEELLALAQAVPASVEDWYQCSPALDGPTETLFLNLGDQPIKTSGFSTLSLPCEDSDTTPPPELGELYQAVEELKILADQEVVLDRIYLGVMNVTSEELDCDATTAIPWPFTNPALPRDLESGFWDISEVDAPDAALVRTFLQENFDDFEPWYPTACVIQDDLLYRVTWEDRLPEAEDLPF